MRLRRPPLRCAAIAVLVLALGARGPAALAHANLVSSDPAPGVRLDAAPGAVVLHFTEQPELSLSDVEVLSPNGARLDRGDLTAPAPRTLRVSLRLPLPPGTYTVAWHCISEIDGHATAGSFAFGVRTNPGRPAKVGSGPRGPSPLEVAARWAFVAGLLAAFGGALLVRGLAPPAFARVRRYVVAGTVLAGLGVVLLALAQHEAARASWRALAATLVGQTIAWRAGGVALALAAVATPDRRAMAPAALGAAGAMAAEAFASHAAASSHPALGMALQWIHFAAAGAWIGGLGALLVAFPPLDQRQRALLARRFSSTAAVSLALVAATGTWRAVDAVGSLHNLVGSTYGLTVLAKAALIVPLALLGARNRFRHVDRVEEDPAPLLRTVRSEFGLGVGVIVATALLLGLAPPPRAVSQALAAEATDLGGAVRARLIVEPGRPGPNTFTVHLRDPSTGRPVRARFVSLRFLFESGPGIGPSTLALRPLVAGTWRGRGTNLSLEGRWNVTVVVQSTETSTEIPLDIATPCDVEVVGGTKNPTIYNEQLAGGASDQAYVTPARAGRNEVHFTFFDSSGGELDVPSLPSVVVWRPGQPARGLTVRRLSAGHFIADARLGAGTWRIEALVTPRNATQPLMACFDQTIRR